MTNDLSYGSLKKLCGRAINPNVGTHMTVDQCVKATTAFADLADMLDTQLTYSPKFNISRACTDAERNAMLRAARGFNYAVERMGQARRAMVF